MAVVFGLTQALDQVGEILFEFLELGLQFLPGFLFSSKGVGLFAAMGGQAFDQLA